MAKTKEYTIQAQIWINEGSNSFLGPGRIMLLENIIKTGSITNAAKEMKMSYRQAWQLVEDMNKHAKEPLVEKILGGKGGSGSKVSKAGEKAIILFKELENKIKLYSEEELKKIQM
ncbi:MAG: ModE family transcriptional regulator [Bacteroidota bacterium]